jgi:hypothetical protein
VDKLRIFTSQKHTIMNKLLIILIVSALGLMSMTTTACSKPMTPQEQYKNDSLKMERAIKKTLKNNLVKA